MIVLSASCDVIQLVWELIILTIVHFMDAIRMKCLFKSMPYTKYYALAFSTHNTTKNILSARCMEFQYKYF